MVRKTEPFIAALVGFSHWLGMPWDYRQYRTSPIGIKKESLALITQHKTLLIKRQLPTLPLLRSTIGVIRLNFSVRNGKRWNPNAIATLIS